MNEYLKRHRLSDTERIIFDAIKEREKILRNKNNKVFKFNMKHADISASRFILKIVLKQQRRDLHNNPFFVIVCDFLTFYRN